MNATLIVDSPAIDANRQAIFDMCYGLAFHMQIAENESIQCADELGRKLWRDIATEHRNLVLMLDFILNGSDESKNAMKAFYESKATQCFAIHIEAGSAKDQETKNRTTLGDLRYFLTYMQAYIGNSLAKVADLATRQDLDNASKIFGQIGNTFQRLDAGDTDYVCWTMAEWKVQCSLHLECKTIDLSS